MYKTILVPVDLAHPEKGGPMIETARRIAETDARIMLLNVIEDVPTYIAAQLPEQMLDDAREHAQQELKAIAGAAGIKPDIEVRSGHAASAILDFAEAQEVDLIVVGSHKPALEDYFLGSTASRVVRHAKCSVLVVR